MGRHPLGIALAGAAAGLAGGLFGVGGGLLLVPLLTGPFGLGQHQAHGTSIAVVGATALTAIVVYALHGNVAWMTAAFVALASVFAARWGARLARRTRPRDLARAFAVFLGLVAVRLLWRAPAAHGVPLSGAAAAAIDLAVGAVLGLTAGYMGVGGGIIAVPAFTLLLGMPQQAAQGTSLAVILVTAPAGTLEHHRLGHVAWRFVPLLAIGAALGSPLGSLLAHRLSAVILSRVFACFLLANAVHLWIRASRPRAPVEVSP
ncbi:MAG TPA: sulfite exporter TauE/SafE family protein [Candidatus Eisenbacteria bacterium]|nr:sulfite exporter TauE/SafE family protein [Candidatus Eisenbacteria bacterium]